MTRLVPLAYMIVTASNALVGTVAVSPAFLTWNKNSCACKNWKQAYQSGDVKCGAGEESWQETNTSNMSLVHSSSSPRVYNLYNDSVKELLCTRFWEVLDSDRCINLNVGEDKGTWCYVDSTCKILQGGSKINDQISWKKCSKNDLKFRDYTPEELYNFSKHQDIGFGGLQKMSYPGSKVGEGHIITSDYINDEMPKWLSLKLEELQNNDMPYWFDTNENATLPFVMIYGSKVYKVEQGPAQNLQHPGTWSILNCTQGC